MSVTRTQPTRGYQGYQGVPGAQGFQGFQGYQGNQGFQGNAGAQGNQGFQGEGAAISDTDDVPEGATNLYFTNTRALDATAAAYVNVTGDTMTGLLTINQATANTAALNITGYSLTGSDATGMVSLAGTWNTSGTPTALLLNITDTASNAASCLADFGTGGGSYVSKWKVDKTGKVTQAGDFVTTKAGTTGPWLYSTDAPTSGFGGGVGGTNGVWLGGTQVVTFGGGGATIGFRNTGIIGWFAGSISGSPDLILLRDAANTLALRNGANAQAFRVYNTYTDASNYERLGIEWVSNSLRIFTSGAGTGLNRNLGLYSGGSLYLGAGGINNYWQVAQIGGHLLAVADNTYDIGASGATRPRHGYFAGRVYVGLSVSLPNGSLIYDGGGNGLVTLSNSTATDFSRLQFGGITSSFPALKRSAATLQVVLANDSGFADLYCAALIATGATITGLSTFDRVAITQSTLTYAATTDIDFSVNAGYRMLALTGNVTFTTSNKAAKAQVTIRVAADATERTLTFPAEWIWVSTKPTTIPANGVGMLILRCESTTEGSVYASWGIDAGSLMEELVIAVGDETTDITTGTAKVTFRMPFAMNVTEVRASLATASSSGNPTFDINEGGTTILSTKLSIDSGEKTSTTAATPPVISDAALADDAEITIDIDTAGTGAKGPKIVLIGTRA